MLRFLADHNFSEIVIAQVLAALPDLDLVRARDITGDLLRHREPGGGRLD